MNNFCPYCGGVMDRDGYLCTKCNERFNIYKHDRVLKLHDNNKCVDCGKEMDRDGWFCKACAKKLNDRSKIRNAFRRENKLCVQCGSPSEGYYYCQRCRDMKNNRHKGDQV